MPVAIVRMLGSKIMSLGLKPTLSTSSWYDLEHTETFCSMEVAWRGREERHMYVHICSFITHAFGRGIHVLSLALRVNQWAKTIWTNIPLHVELHVTEH